VKFLVDGTTVQVASRRALWPEGVAGQLQTPGSRWRIEEGETFAIDNGAYIRLDLPGFTRQVIKYEHRRPMFVALPDKVGCHKTTLAMYYEYAHLARTCVRAFVAQDGFDEIPSCAKAIFIGGTNEFKDSDEALDVVRRSVQSGLHVHVGRVNTVSRFLRYRVAGAHTCDGSGFSRYDHMVIALRDAVNRSQDE
jgi:hypothetical protein